MGRASLLEGADGGRAGVGTDHAAFLAVLGHKDIPVSDSAALAFHHHHPGAIGIQRIGAVECLTLSEIPVTDRSLLASEGAISVEGEGAIM